MTPAIARRIPAPLSALAALAALTLSVPLALIGAPSQAAVPAEDAPTSFKFTMDIVVNSNETYSAKFEMSESEDTAILKEDFCSKDTFSASGSSDLENVKVAYKDEGNTRTCIMEGTAKVSDNKGEVTHKNGEYSVTTPDFSSSTAGADIPVTQSVTFPGKVTEADGGKVEGNKVTFTDADSHTVKGKDGSIPMWVWILVGVGVVAVIGGGVAAFLITRGKKNKGQPAYGAPAQGYDPNQAFPAQQPGQPDQQAGYGAPQAQPGQQAGYGAPQVQPGQPGQSSYGGGQPGQPGQGTY